MRQGNTLRQEKDKQLLITRQQIYASLFASTIFIGAFLLFQIQPLIAKFILPWFGGAPSVWTTCMLFFQLMLLAGYLYSHLLCKHLSLKWQVSLHCLLLIVSVCMLSVEPSASWKPNETASPVSHILRLLAVHIGLPYFILATTSPLLQAWYSRGSSNLSVYRLYAVSNTGAFLALLSFPFVFEPTLGSSAQAQIWSFAYAFFALICSACAAVTLFVRFQSQTAAASQAREANSKTSSSAALKAYWFMLAATGSVLLLAATNKVCYDIAVMPFLWVIPLGLYLLTFIICFESNKGYSRGVHYLLFAVFLLILVDPQMQSAVSGVNAAIPLVVAFHFGLLFVCCMICHGELAQLKPEAGQLTSFYLMIAAGGAAGGVFVGLAAPKIFSSYMELPLGLALTGLLMLGLFLRRVKLKTKSSPTQWRFAAMSASLVIAALLLLNLERFSEKNRGSANLSAATRTASLAQLRNFYGVLRVWEQNSEKEEESKRTLYHGQVLHGTQFLAADKQLEPTSYYGRQSGVGLAFEHLLKRPRRTIGAIGLGVGTIAAYMKSGDHFRFYEIDPDVIRLAKQYFTFLANDSEQVEVVLGDARLSLEREAPQDFDLLVVDAFSGDAIPMHLLTKEAFETYIQHLKPGAIMALHISNRHINLQPVIAGAAKDFMLHSTVIHSKADASQGTSKAIWVLLSTEEESLQHPAIEEAKSELQAEHIQRWTDDFSNVIRLLK